MKQQPLLDIDPHARRDNDFYSTFGWQTAVLLQRLPLRPEWVILEPAAGLGAISSMLAKRLPRIWTNDIEQRAFPDGVPFHLNSTLDATKPESWQSWVEPLDRLYGRGGVDVTVTNLPFGIAFEIIQLALQYSRVAVITLLRHTWDEPTIDRNEWLAAHPLTAKIVMPRAKYRGISSTESATHSWFIWVKDQEQLDPESEHGAQFALLQPHETVTIKECVQHAIRLGEDPATIAGWTAAT